MGIPLIQQYRLGQYLLPKNLRGEQRNPPALMPEPLIQCNLARCIAAGVTDISCSPGHRYQQPPSQIIFSSQRQNKQAQNSS